MKVYLLRHGEIECGAEMRFIGQTDVPLSDTGVKQALWWRDALEPVAVEGIYCSDLVRSRHTAEIVAQKQTSPLTVVPELREIGLGEWDGLTVDEVRTAFPGEWEKRGQNIDGYRPSGGESFSDLAFRALPAFDRIMNKGRKTALVVGHAGVNRVILCEVSRHALETSFPTSSGLRRSEHHRGPLRLLASLSGKLEALLGTGWRKFRLGLGVRQASCLPSLSQAGTSTEIV